MPKVRPLEGDLRTFTNVMMKNLDESQRRLFLASFSEYLGYGGATKLSEVTGVSQQTISVGKKELKLGRPTVETQIMVTGASAQRVADAKQFLKNIRKSSICSKDFWTEAL